LTDSSTSTKRLLIQRIWALLLPRERRAGLYLFALMIGGSLLETLSVGLIIPAMAVLVDPNAARRMLPHWISGGAVRTNDAMIVFGMLMLVVVYLAKNAYLAYFAWRQNKFTFDATANMSERLFVRYLHQPYTFHLQRNSAELIRNVMGEVDIFTANIVRPSMQLVAECLTLVGLITLVLLAEPVGAVIVATIGAVAAMAFHFMTKSHVLRWGEARQLTSGLRFQHLQQGLAGAKEVKLLGREQDFVESFSLNTRRYARVGSLQNTVLELPRLWLELLAVAGLAAIVIAMVVQHRSVSSILPTIGLFTAAAFRLMPGLNRILTSSQALKFGLPVVRILATELTDYKVEPLVARDSAKPLPLVDSLSLDRVSFRYAGSHARALHDISANIPAGAMVGIIGESGAGKSTLVDIILGLLTPETGSVRVDGVDVQSNLRGWQNEIGYVPQTIFLTDDSIRRNVAFGLPAAAIDDTAVWRALAAAKLEEFVRTLPLGLDTVVGERGVRLSGGQRQRIGIARALYHEPAVLVLDEATSSLDPATEQEVMVAVRALHGRKTIIIVSHRFSTVQDCDALYRLEAGRVAQEGDARVLLKAQALAR
jgi:ABC-type multidrug transport system fused ATPase/permease subunit